MRIVLLVDSSLSVASMVNPFRAALHEFLAGLPGEPEIALITTGGSLRIRVGPTSDREKLLEVAGRFTSDGGGNTLLDSLLEADQRVLQSAPDHRPVIVILSTDLQVNLWEVRTAQYNRFLESFLRRGGRAHAIIIHGSNSSGAPTQIAANLTKNTGGFYETVVYANAIPELMKTVAEYVAADL